VKLYNTETKTKTDFVPRDPSHVTMYVVDISVITEKFTKAYHQDLAALGVLAPDVEPKVTDHIAEIHQFIQSLIDKGHAYEGEGNVLFNVSSFDAYGGLSKRNPDELLAGARIDVASYKKHPARLAY